ncbi:hypothetical protein MAP00_008464 [Monascus purpureus]|nr:hypothetical protein MAP00_008464 [Monascus purpureus]
MMDLFLSACIALNIVLICGCDRTRGEFRRAQLQAKRNAELAKRKERELLFSRSANAEAEGVRQTSEKLTQDELMVNASNDVTSALKRTYYLMQAELSRSQFAQQTLEQSNAALASLSESYGGLDSLLSSSRSLVGSLLRSQKSDTWYLETAFYVLVGTIIWLIFRRILYGPFWWLVWFPMRLIARFTLAVLGAVGLTSTNALQSSATASLSSTLTPGFVHKTEVPAIESVTGSASWNQEPVTTEGDRLIDRIGKMATGEAEMEETNVDDISPEERKRQEEMPRNSKKRMYEEVINENRRDEL